MRWYNFTPILVNILTSNNSFVNLNWSWAVTYTEEEIKMFYFKSEGLNILSNYMITFGKMTLDFHLGVILVQLFYWKQLRTLDKIFSRIFLKLTKHWGVPGWVQEEENNVENWVWCSRVTSPLDMFANLEEVSKYLPLTRCAERWCESVCRPGRSSCTGLEGKTCKVQPQQLWVPL